MLNYLKLEDVGPAAPMTIDLAKRLTLLTGDNGVGKTFALDLTWWALTRTWVGEEAFPHRGRGLKPRIEYQVWGTTGLSRPVEAVFDYQLQTWKLPGKRPSKVGLVIYARVDGSFSVWDPARNYWRKAPSMSVDAPDRPAAFHFDRKSIWDGLELGGKVVCNGLIRDWVSWQLQKAEAFDALCAALEILSPSPDWILKPSKPMRISLDEARDIPTLELPYGRVPLTHASAGMRRILGLAYLLVWARYEHVEASLLLNQEADKRLVLLYDEVETHLHPQWQRRVLPALLEAAREVTKDAELQCIASTHAPLVMASIEPRFDTDLDRALEFDLVDGVVQLREIPWHRRGDASAWLTDVFKLRRAYALEAEQAMERAADVMKQYLADKAQLETLREAHNELRKYLADLDPFWVRWLYLLEAKEIKL